MTSSAPDMLRSLCIDLAEGAGRRALSGRSTDLTSTASVVAETKSSVTDLVTPHDRAAEDYIRKRLAAERPGDGFIGEERGDESGTTGLTWIVDPIDGTTNFVYGLPAWGPSVAVAVDDVVVAGAVHFPMTGETFHASLGGGAALGDVPIRVTSQRDVGTTLIATGFGYDAAVRSRQGHRIARLLPLIRDIRRSGSAAHDLCSVACGRVDAYIEDRLNIWDIAAGMLIACEAGAIATSFDGGPPTPDSIVVSAPGVHHALVKLLGEPDR